MYKIILYISLTLFGLVLKVSGHGRLVDPPARGTMWRLGFDTPPNYNDHQLFCGGFSRQWVENGGRCGECGDAWDIPRPRPNEAGGIWGTGTISKAYREGQVITSTVHLTANHQGWFEFRLCENNDPKQYVKQSCLNKNVLKLVDHPGTRYQIKHSQRGLFRIRLQLPERLTCSQCVFQWHYTTGNNWGFCKDGENRPGCGAQEVFRGCSDVAVFARDDPMYFQYLNLTTDADLGKFFDTENVEEGEDHEHHHIHHHHHHEGNSIDNDRSENLEDDIIINDSLKLLTPSTPTIKSHFNIKTEGFRNPDYFNEDNLLRKKIEIYNNYISSDSFRRNRGRGSPTYKRIRPEVSSQPPSQNRPPPSQIVWNHLTPNMDTTTIPNLLFEQSPQLLNALAAVLNDPPSQEITDMPVDITPTTLRPTISNIPGSTGIPLLTSTSSNEPNQMDEISKLLSLSNLGNGGTEDIEFKKIVTDSRTTAPPVTDIHMITTRRNEFPPNIPGVNQLALVPRGQQPVIGETKPSALAFQIPLSEIQNTGTLERILMLQKAFGASANGGTDVENQQDSPLVFIVV